MDTSEAFYYDGRQAMATAATIAMRAPVARARGAATRAPTLAPVMRQTPATRMAMAPARTPPLLLHPKGVPSLHPLLVCDLACIVLRGA